jgi:hypothetical protein
MSLFKVSVLLILLAPGQDPQERRESPYFPLAVGCRWHYRGGDQKYTQQVVRNEKVGEMLCALIETRDRRDQLIGNEHLAVAGDGVYRYSYNGQPVVPPLRLFKLPARPGDSWKVESRIGADVLKGAFRSSQEDVAVPAGRYSTLHVTSEDAQVNDIPFVFSSWYATGVGLVKQVIQVNGKDVVVELERYEAAR